tara:strand:- start:473 stop:985 length:513 start_codon:yes stop_codon:yes gene_type:complete
MKIDLNKIISALIIIIGHGFFFLNIGYSIPFAIISIISTFLIWMLWTKLVNTFNLNVFFNLIAFSGLIVSITTFAYFGIEPIGTRKGTLVHFHSGGIAVALSIFFVTLLPYIIFNLKFNLPTPLNITVKSGFKNKPKQTKKTEKDQYIVGDRDWELASDDDIVSGDYNIE